MSIKTYRPTTPARRQMTASGFDGVAKHVKPEKSLTEVLKKNSGRNSYGRITVRHQGGGNRTKYRVIDFKRQKTDMPATVKTLEYDPNRSANLALLKYEDGTLSYILAAEGMKPGMTLMSGEKAEATPGNSLPLSMIPLGPMVHCVELVPGQGAKVARSAGTEAQLMARDGDTVTLKMSSGEVRIFDGRCLACVGSVGNKDWGSIKLGKAGRKRYMGIRPTVRGVAMNPVDHPMGGGEGRTSGGSHPRSPWGQLAKGGKTRAQRKASNKVIVTRRK